MEDLKLGKYKHFKGMEVEVIGIALDSENLEKMVVYNHPDPVKGEGSDTMWVRPLDMFIETIERDGKMVKRFEYIG
ncbi:MAG: DUF1653 domain-containing protein [Candidatus Pacebacteria bacterium]|nr:DUF1653 domain-containing protein [Candidatus Paceibacterota bacterium]